VFITFCVILATLVAQGLTLPLLVRLLGLQGSAGPACEEREARRIAVESALGTWNSRARATGPISPPSTTTSPCTIASGSPASPATPHRSKASR